MPSLRAIAKEMGINHSYLSRLLNGQRQWTPELYEKYNQLQLGTMVPTSGENQIQNQASGCLLSSGPWVRIPPGTPHSVSAFVGALSPYLYPARDQGRKLRV